MPECGSFSPFDANEFQAARKYVLAKAAACGLTLKEHDLVDVLVNESGADVHVYPVQCDSQGFFSLYFRTEEDTGRWSAVCGPVGVHTLALLDVNTSKLMLIRSSDLYDACRNAAGLQGYLSCGRQGNWIVVRLHAAWAEVRLAKQAAELGKASDYGKWRRSEMAAPEQFVHLHLHSMYSLLDGASSIDAIVNRVKCNGQPGVALTDHGFMYGTYKFYKAAKKAGVKPLLGVEAYLVDDVKQRYSDAEGGSRRFEYHITLLAMNQVGFQNLCHMGMLAARDHFYSVPRIDHDMLFRHQEGLIVLSGCFKGQVAWHLQQFEEPSDSTRSPIIGPGGLRVYRRDPDHSRRVMRQFKQVFGDRYYAEVMPIDYQRYMDAVPAILQMAHEEQVPVVATCDAHYERAEDAVLQWLLVQINTGNRIDQIGEGRIERGCHFIRQRHEMEHPLLSPDMLTRTCEIMDRCNVNLDFDGYLFPDYPLEQDKDWSAYQAAVKG